VHGRWLKWNPVPHETGSASLVAVAMMVVLLAFTVGGVYMGAAVAARHRAQAAADLAALAAAGRMAGGAATACSVASAVAQATGAVITRCVVEHLDVVVEAEVPIALGRFGFGPAGAVARAGPAVLDGQALGVSVVSAPSSAP
jgi:secretion/DNA translocation related TadE-like protein